MIVNGDQVNFDRVVYLTIARNSAAAAAYEAGQTLAGKSNDGIITLVFNPQLKREYCTRIDAVISKVGRFSDRNPANSTARISLWNPSEKIKTFLDEYNAFDAHGTPYNIVSAKKSAIILQVGYVGGPRQTVFSGWIGSFNNVRHQTKDTIDNELQFFCAYPGLDVPVMEDSDRGVSGTDYLADAELESFYNSQLSPELQLKQIAYRYPRTVYVDATVAQSYTASFLSNLGMEVQAQETSTQQSIVYVPQTMKITPDNFDKYYVIKYVSNSRGQDPNNELRRIWQTEQAMYPLPVDMTNLEHGMDMLAIQLNCRARFGRILSDGRQEILIWRAGTNATSYRNWVIKNFQNVLQPPRMGMSGMAITIMMEPDMLPFDSVELQLDDSFTGMKIPSFVGEYGRTAYAPFIAGTSSVGSPEWAPTTNAELSAKYGNIFFKRFNIAHIEHNLSTHTNNWTTTLTTRGPDMNTVYEQVGLENE